MSKYRAIKTTVDNIVFASKREAVRYVELKLLLRANKIQTLEVQPRYHLHVRGIKIGRYIADFTYFESGKHVVEDCKGFRTPLYRWKKKHFEAEYKVEIRET